MSDKVQQDVLYLPYTPQRKSMTLLDSVRLSVVDDALGSMSVSDMTANERFKILMALGTLGEDGIVLASGWSGKPMNEVRKTLRRCDSGRISIGTLFYEARSRGWNDRRTGVGALFNFTANHTYNERYLRPITVSELPNDTRILGVRSEKGTGKTEFVKGLVEKYSDDVTVLNIAHRRTLLAQAAERLSIDYYEDIEADKLPDTKKLSITLDSLPKLATKRLPKNIGLVVIDEATQVFQHLMGDTIHRDRINVLTTLAHIFQRATLVVLLDADLTDIEVNFVRGLMGSNVNAYTVENEFKYDGRSTKAYTDKNDLASVAIEALKNGESCYVACNTREMAVSFYEALKVHCTGKHRLITSHETHEADTRDFIKKIDKRIKEVQLVVASPSLGTGIDIQTPIDHVFLVATDFDGLSHADLLQQLWRVRNPGTVHTWVHSKEYKKVIDPTTLRTEIIEAGRVVIDYNEDGERVVIRNRTEELYLDLWCSNTAKLNYSTNRLNENFYKALSVAGWSIQWCEETVKQTDIDKEGKARKKAARELEIECLINAPIIDKAEYTALMKKSDEDLTHGERTIATAYRIRLAYAVDVITPEIALHYNGGDGARQVTNYLDITTKISDTDKLLNLDKKDAQHVFLPDIRHRDIKASVRSKVLTLAFGTDDIDRIINGDVATTKEGIDALETWRKRASDRVKVMLGITGTGTHLVRSVLGQIGLSLVAEKRSVDANGKRFRSYRVKGSEFMNDIRERHAKKTEEMQKILEDRDF